MNINEKSPKQETFLFMRMLFSLYRFFNLLSLDVVAGSVCCALFFSTVYQTSLERNSLIVLGLTVWLIYTADHLLDASKLKDNVVTQRHYFHKKYFTGLMIASLIVFILDFVLMLRLPPEIISRGIFAILFVVLYLVFHSRLTFMKEVVSAILYCTGILIPIMPSTFDGFQILLFLQFFLVVTLNLTLFALLELENDVQQKSKSVATALGETKTRKIVWALFLLNTLIWCINVIHPESFIVWMMGLLHMVIFVGSSFFARDERYRLIGDAIFLLPVIYLFL